MVTADANVLNEYLDNRCRKALGHLSDLKALKVLGLEELPVDIRESSSDRLPLETIGTKARLDVKFNKRVLGQIFAESFKSDYFTQAHVREQLLQLAGEVSCLFNLEDTGRILKLDSLVEEMALSRPQKYHWTGVYLLLAPETLTLASYRGAPSPHEVIPIDQGICGAAVREEKTLNIGDVKSDDRYLSCSVKTMSEIVVPIFLTAKSGERRIVGEIDIDSHVKNAFTADDERHLAEYSRKIADIFM